jgi:proton-dependent oligopeptide transporter, POT family
MFKNHPKGLIIAFFSNMGERFGFYTMMACLVFYLQAKGNGMSATDAGEIYSWFYFAIYAFALIGGFIADGTRKYKTTIFFGILTMLIGYIIMTVPGLSMAVTIAGLGVIAFGNGLFKGNLQAIVGQMYDDPKYSKLRDSAFSVFYMGINMGALVAPFAANGIRNWYLRTQNFTYNSDIQAYAAKFNIGELPLLNTGDVIDFAEKSSNMMAASGINNLSVFVKQYLEAFATGYNFAFGVAAVAMIISFTVFIIFKGKLPDKSFEVNDAHVGANAGGKKNSPSLVKVVISLALMAATALIFHFALDKLMLGLAIGLFVAFVAWIFQNATKEERPRVNALMMVFIVVIFFWMSFHQNGLTLSFFARDYVDNAISPASNMLFTFPSLLCIFAFIIGIVYLFNGKTTQRNRLLGGALAAAGIGVGYYLYSTFKSSNAIEPEIFQTFNPTFIVFLTPVFLAFIALLRKKNIEPSTPRKIGIGMLLAALGFVVLIIGSFGLESPASLQGTPSPDRVSVYWLINTYLVLTIAELFLSPMGISFVSKVSPTRFQGLMQGGWLLATATGNKLLFIGSSFWDKIEIWELWAIFVLCCLASAAFVFSIMKRLENATK